MLNPEVPEPEPPWAGQFDSFEDFYRETFALLHRAALRVLRDAALAEEVVQEIYLEILREPAGFDPERGSLRAWLLTIARRRAIDRVRSVATARDYDERFARLDTGRSGESVEEAVQRHAEHEQVRDAVGELSEQNREMLRQIYWHGLSYRDLALRLDIPLGTLKTRMHQALKRLRRTMD
jgi:RNA polymerase sigma-70 factor (ECF subfamily)